MQENLDKEMWTEMSCFESFVSTIVFTLFVVALCGEFCGHKLFQVQPLTSHYISSTNDRLLYKFDQ